MTVLLPTIAYAITFNGSVLLTVEIPQIFIPKFGFDAQQLGLQFLGMIIGTVIGEQAGGPLSDWIMNSKTKRVQRQRHDASAGAQPEFRLWLSYAGFFTVIVGFIVWGVMTQVLPPDGYNVSPIVGIGIFAFGAQIVTTVLVTYAVESTGLKGGSSADVGVFISLVRQIWAFIGPFWFPSMFASVGIAGSAGVMCGITVAAAVLPVVACQVWGRKWRGVRKDEI